MDALVTLRDGSQVSETTYKTTFPKLESLNKQNSIALWDLMEKCRNASSNSKFELVQTSLRPLYFIRSKWIKTLLLLALKIIDLFVLRSLKKHPLAI